LYSAVEEAMRALGDAEFGDTIYVVTDGGENLSAISQRRLVQNLITDGIRTFVFLVNTSDFKTPEECEGSQNMEELAGQTGVSPPLAEEWVSDVSLRLWRSKSSVQRPRLMRSIFSSMRRLPSPPNSNSRHRIDPKHFTLAYPHRLEPCTTKSQP
jgi:hypothetical protein